MCHIFIKADRNADKNTKLHQRNYLGTKSINTTKTPPEHDDS